METILMTITFTIIMTLIVLAFIDLHKKLNQQRKDIIKRFKRMEEEQREMRHQLYNKLQEEFHGENK